MPRPDDERRRWLDEQSDETSRIIADQEGERAQEIARELQLDEAFRKLVTDEELLTYIKVRGTHLPLGWQDIGFFFRKTVPSLSISDEGAMQIHINEPDGIAVVQAKLLQVEGDRAIVPGQRPLRIPEGQVEKFSHLIDPKDKTAFIITQDDLIPYFQLHSGNMLGRLYATTLRNVDPAQLPNAVNANRNNIQQELYR
jgi:hypothetical protein